MKPRIPWRMRWALFRYRWWDCYWNSYPAYRLRQRVAREVGECAIPAGLGLGIGLWLWWILSTLLGLL